MKKNILKIFLAFFLLLSSFSFVHAVTIFNVNQGGTGVGTITGIIQGNGTSPFSAITVGSGLSFSSGSLSVNGSAITGLPASSVVSGTFGTGAYAMDTSLTNPLLIGGTTTTSPLKIRSTSGVGTTGADIVFQTGNNGATEDGRILNNGQFGWGVHPYPSIVVSGTLTPNLTGMYVFSGFFNSHPYYTGPSGFIWWAGNPNWFISPSLGVQNQDFYNSTASTPPLNSSWGSQNGASGTLTTANVTVQTPALMIDNSGNLTTYGSVNALTGASIAFTNISQFSASGGVGTWFDMSTSGPSGIGTGGAGVNPWIAYVYAANNWFSGSVAGDVAYRNLSGRLLFGNQVGGTPSLIIQNNGLGGLELNLPTLTASTGLGLDSSKNIVSIVVPNDAASQTTYTGSISGSAVWSMPSKGASYKKFFINFNALHDAGGTVTFPISFSKTPFCYGDSTALAVSSASTSTFTIAVSATITGNVFCEGY